MKDRAASRSNTSSSKPAHSSLFHDFIQFSTSCGSRSRSSQNCTIRFGVGRPWQKGVLKASSRRWTNARTKFERLRSDGVRGSVLLAIFEIHFATYPLHQACTGIKRSQPSQGATIAEPGARTLARLRAIGQAQPTPVNADRRNSIGAGRGSASVSRLIRRPVVATFAASGVSRPCLRMTASSQTPPLELTSNYVRFQAIDEPSATTYLKVRRGNDRSGRRICLVSDRICPSISSNSSTVSSCPALSSVEFCPRTATSCASSSSAVISANSAGMSRRPSISSLSAIRRPCSTRRPSR